MDSQTTSWHPAWTINGTKLHDICRRIDVSTEEIIESIKSGISVNFVDHDGDTALHIYLRRVPCIEESIIRLFLVKGFNLRISGKLGYNVLHCACGNKSVNANILEMLATDFNINKSTDDYALQKPLHYACLNKSISKEVVKILIRKGACVNLTNGYGNNSLHYVCGNDNAKKEIIEILISEGAEVNSSDFIGYTPLHNACCNSKISKEIIETLVNKGAEINSTDRDGCTPLHYVCRRKDISKEIIETFIKKGSNINSINISGYTPLHYACYNDEISKEIIEILITRGGNINLKDEVDKKALLSLKNRIGLSKDQSIEDWYENSIRKMKEKFLFLPLLIWKFGDNENIKKIPREILIEIMNRLGILPKGK